MIKNGWVNIGKKINEEDDVERKMMAPTISSKCEVTTVAAAATATTIAQ